MSYYIGFLKESSKHAVVFRSIVKPKKSDFTYFLKVVGPYRSFEGAKDGLKRIRGAKENPVIDSISKSDIMDAVRLSKKMYKIYKGIRKKNPVDDNNYTKFLQYMGELERHVVGSRMYNETLAKAYAHLKVVKTAMKK